MTRHLACPFVLLALVVGVAGCGESDKERYVDDYKPLNDRLLEIGDDLGQALRGAAETSDAALARQFAGLARDLRGVGDDIEALDTPDELQDESEALTGRIDDAAEQLEDISSAAKENDPEAAAAATVKLGGVSEKVNEAQNRLARATGARVGER